MLRKAATGPVEVMSSVLGAPAVDAAGYVLAVIGTYGEVDAHGDVLVKGCFADTGVFPISAYGHGSWESGIGALPVGLGTIREGDQPVLAAKFFDTFAGRETFATVKQLGEVGQWSWGYDVLDDAAGEVNGRRVRLLRRVAIHEACPVLVGASVGTATVAVHELRGEPAPEQVEAAREFLRFVAIRQSIGGVR